MIRAPWTQQQVDALNAFQVDGRFHPFTCPGEFPMCKLKRELTATTEGWTCACGQYRQDWAHDMMLDPPKLREGEL